MASWLLSFLWNPFATQTHLPEPIAKAIECLRWSLANVKCRPSTRTLLPPFRRHTALLGRIGPIWPIDFVPTSILSFRPWCFNSTFHHHVSWPRGVNLFSEQSYDLYPSTEAFYIQMKSSLTNITIDTLINLIHIQMVFLVETGSLYHEWWLCIQVEFFFLTSQSS